LQSPIKLADDFLFLELICMAKAYMYILLCSNGRYYTGSARDLKSRIQKHQTGKGANYTRKYRPIKLVYFEVFDRIDHAFIREKQIQRWTHKKKKALIQGNNKLLKNL